MAPPTAAHALVYPPATPPATLLAVFNLPFWFILLSSTLFHPPPGRPPLSHLSSRDSIRMLWRMLQGAALYRGPALCPPPPGFERELICKWGTQLPFPSFYHWVWLFIAQLFHFLLCATLNRTNHHFLGWAFYANEAAGDVTASWPLWRQSKGSSATKSGTLMQIDDRKFDGCAHFRFHSLSLQST